MNCALHGYFEGYCDECREEELETLHDLVTMESDGD